MKLQFKKELLEQMIESAAQNTGRTKWAVIEEIGLTPSSYHYYIKGRVPDIVTISKLAHYFRVSRDFFFDDEEETGDGGGMLVAASTDVKPARRRKNPVVDESQMRLLTQRIEDLQTELRQALVLLKGRGVAWSGHVAEWLHGWLHPAVAIM